MILRTLEYDIQFFQNFYLAFVFSIKYLKCLNSFSASDSVFHDTKNIVFERKEISD